MFFLLSLSFCGIVVAQSQTLSGFDANANLANADQSMFRSFDNRYEGVRGQSTVFEDFVEGNVNMKSGERVEGQALNYDVMTGQLIVRSRVYKKILSVRYDLVESFELFDEEGEMFFYKKATERGFCQVIHEGNRIKMYLKPVKTVQKANFGGAYNANARNYDEFIDENVYLISTNGGALEEIKPQRKAFEKKFPEKKELIQRYFKDNKPDLKKWKELGQFIAYLDTNS